MTDEVVAKYIELQGELPEDDESFRGKRVILRRAPLGDFSRPRTHRL